MHIRSIIQAYATGVLHDEDKGKDFADRCWGLFMSTIEASYEAKLHEILHNWHGGLVGYVENTWLMMYKKNIVRSWTNIRIHFYTRTINKYIFLVTLKMKLLIIVML